MERNGILRSKRPPHTLLNIAPQSRSQPRSLKCQWLLPRSLKCQWLLPRSLIAGLPSAAAVSCAHILAAVSRQLSDLPSSFAPAAAAVDMYRRLGYFNNQLYVVKRTRAYTRFCLHCFRSSRTMQTSVSKDSLWNGLRRGRAPGRTAQGQPRQPPMAGLS